jgi:Flp pilus assembly protein TadG
MPLKSLLRRNQSGMATLELALVAPVLVLLIIGALDFSRLIVAYATINNASREGARYAVLHPGASAPDIKREVQRRSAPLDTGALSVSIEVEGAGGDSQEWSPAYSTRTPTAGVVKVTVRYPWQAASLLTGAFFSSQSIESVASAETRR